MTVKAGCSNDAVRCIVGDVRDRIRRSAGLYRVMLWLYPRGFRAAYGGAMREAFESWLADEAERDGARGIRRVWRATLGEIVPTVMREHVGEMVEFIRSGGVGRAARVLVACAGPVGAYWGLARLAVQVQDLVVLAVWFALMGAGMVRAGGRGWACNRNAMVAAGVGVGAPLLWLALTVRTTPNVFWVAPVLVGAAVTIGLIVSTVVRVVMEGVGGEGYA